MLQPRLLCNYKLHRPGLLPMPACGNWVTTRPAGRVPLWPWLMVLTDAPLLLLTIAARLTVGWAPETVAMETCGLSAAIDTAPGVGVAPGDGLPTAAEKEKWGYCVILLQWLPSIISFPELENVSNNCMIILSTKSDLTSMGRKNLWQKHCPPFCE